MGKLSEDFIIECLSIAAHATIAGDSLRAQTALQELPSSQTVRQAIADERVRRLEFLSRVGDPGTRIKTAASLRPEPVFKRDSFRCRHIGCGRRPVRTGPRCVGTCISQGILWFQNHHKEAECHAIADLLSASPDHVEAQYLGGSDSLDNLVTACYICRYKLKLGRSLGRLGWPDPRSQEPISDGSFGLSELYPPLERAVGPLPKGWVCREWRSALEAAISRKPLQASGPRP